MHMTELNEEIAAYDAMRDQIEFLYAGKWVLVHDRQLIGAYNSFKAAAADAARRFGRKDFLIRQVATPIPGPATFAFS